MVLRNLVRSPLIYAVFAGAPLFAAAPATAQIAPAPQSRDTKILMVNKSMQDFSACIDAKLSKRTTYLGAIELCKPRLPNGSEIHILSDHEEMTRWLPNSPKPPEVVLSKIAFSVCAQEALSTQTDPITENSLKAIVQVCETKYFPDCDCHVDSRISPDGSLMITILPGKSKRTELIPNRFTSALDWQPA